MAEVMDMKITGYPYKFTNLQVQEQHANQSDGWFMGMVPNLVTGVWVVMKIVQPAFKVLPTGKGLQLHYLFGLTFETLLC
jgi:penicillin-binding protein 1A